MCLDDLLDIILRREHRLDLLGYQPSKTELDQLYENFLVMADEKKNVNDEDLMVLIANKQILVSQK